MKKPLLGSLISVALAVMAHDALAFEPFTVKDIRVEGIQRTDAGTVFSYLPVKVGETMDDEKASKAVKALFATGFFRDVRLEIQNNVLIVVVEERPAIAAIDFVGMKAFEKDKITKSLAEVGLAESRILDRSVLDRAEQELKRQYLVKGYYDAKITTTVTPLERNRVGINFNIDEGEIAKIRHINIVGNKAFPEKQLLSIMTLTTPGWFTWWTKNDQYSKQKLAADLETLRSWYMDRGYLEFSIDSTQVTISPDKKDIYITINVSEGPKYTVSSIKLTGNLLVPEGELRKLVKLKPGDVYSRALMTDTTKAISDRLGDDGYAFANVNAAPELDKEKHEVAFTIYVDPGHRVYVRNINISGNSRTRDVVVRREIRQMEDAWYDGNAIRNSRNRVDRLGYFEDVSVETPQVPGTTDQVDLGVKVKEKPTGAISLGAGFSSAEKVALSASISQENLFGTGKTASLGVNTSKVNTLYSFTYTNPYYTVDGISAGINVYHRNINTSTLSSVAFYKANSTGAGVKIGIPISDTDYLNMGLAFDVTTLGVSTSCDDGTQAVVGSGCDDGTTISPQTYIDYINKNGTHYNSVIPSIGWSRNSLDSRLYPTSGTITHVNLELAVPPGDLQYYKATASTQRYWPLSKTYTLETSGHLGYAGSLGSKDYPFFKNFYAGGIGSVRGYDTSSLGPSVNDPYYGTERIGGTKLATGSLELLFPFPGSALDKSVRMATFIDGGQVWGANDPINFASVRYSTGLSIIWSSPMGPLEFSIAKPLNSKPGDDLQTFQFTMGQVF